MSKPLHTFYEATKYLGQFVGKDVDFLHTTSCMDTRTRLAIAGIEAAIIIMKNEQPIDNDGIKELEENKRILELFGFASWPRDTVTDMALRHIETSSQVCPDYTLRS